jgi:uncharacterized protein YceK
MTKYAIILSIIFILFLSGCKTVRQASRETYLRQIQEIEQVYTNKEITKAEYLRLKMQAENAFQQREATISY